MPQAIKRLRQIQIRAHLADVPAPMSIHFNSAVAKGKQRMAPKLEPFTGETKSRALRRSAKWPSWLAPKELTVCPTLRASVEPAIA